MSRITRRRAFLAVGSALAILLACTGMWDWRRWNQYMEEARRAVPIAFFGKVVDEAGNPVRASVRLRVTTWNRTYILGASSATRTNHVESQTDVAGDFSIQDQSGFALYVDAISAQGYKYVRRRNEGAYYFSRSGNKDGSGSPYTPDASHPEVFTVEREATR